MYVAITCLSVGLSVSVCACVYLSHSCSPAQLAWGVYRAIFWASRDYTASTLLGHSACCAKVQSCDTCMRINPTVFCKLVSVQVLLDESDQAEYVGNKKKSYKSITARYGEP